MKTRIAIVLLTLALIVGPMFGAMSRGNRAIAGFGSAGVPLNVSNATGVLAPANGGTGAATGAPAWARTFGTGSEGAGPGTGTVNGTHFYSGWTCTGAISISLAPGLIVYSTGAVVFNAACVVTGSNKNVSNAGKLGGAGGSGGSEGAVNSAATAHSTWSSEVGTAYDISAAAAASSSSAGNDGGTIAAATITQLITMGYPFPSLGGGPGSAGANTGGAAGAGGDVFIVVAPSITVASGAIIDVSGGEGGDSAALLHGAGGGGGGGSIQFYSQTFTNNGGIFRYGGGPSGNCTTPSVNPTGGGCDTTGCGKDASIVITALTAGGLDAAQMTLTSGGTGFKTAPVCTVNVGASGLTGSPACHFAAPIAGAIALPIIDTAGSGGTLSSFAASCQIGGYGANGFYNQQLIQ